MRLTPREAQQVEAALDDPPVVHVDHQIKGFKQVWHCIPPEWGTAFQVTSESWVDGEETVRHIYAWEAWA